MLAYFEDHTNKTLIYNKSAYSISLAESTIRERLRNISILSKQNMNINVGVLSLQKTVRLMPYTYTSCQKF